MSSFKCFLTSGKLFYNRQVKNFRNKEWFLIPLVVPFIENQKHFHIYTHEKKQNIAFTKPFKNLMPSELLRLRNIGRALGIPDMRWDDSQERSHLDCPWIQLNTLEWHGIVDCGELKPSVKNGVANHALVLIFRPCRGNWVQPIACFASEFKKKKRFYTNK